MGSEMCIRDRLLVIAAIMKKQAPDSSNNIAMSVAACIAAGAFGGFFSP